MVSLELSEQECRDLVMALGAAKMEGTVSALAPVVMRFIMLSQKIGSLLDNSPPFTESTVGGERSG